MTEVALLEVDSVAHSFGGVQAVAGVNLKVSEGVFKGLIGPNGAGKSTLIDCISGHFRSYRGHVRFAGLDITGWPLHRVAQAGLERTFQTSRMFHRLTVLSSLMVAPMHQRGESLLWSLLGGWRNQESQLVNEARSLVTEFGLEALADSYAGEVSGGQQRLTELTRALMMKPRMLLLDEPFAGVSPTNRKRLVVLLKALNQERGLTILMVEHRLEMVEQLCDSIIVMAEGRVIAEDTMANLRKNPKVVDAYLGAVKLSGS